MNRHPSFLVALAALLATPAAQAIVGYNGAVSGTGLDLLDGEAKLLLTTSRGTLGCTGSLLAGGSYVLTAAHCLTDGTGAPDASSISLSFMGGAVTASSSTYYVDPSWDGTHLGQGNDLALIQLSSPVTTIGGYNLYTGTADSVLSQTILLAGYGYTGSGRTGYQSGTFGSLNYGYNVYDITGSDAGMSDSMFLFDFDSGKDRDNLFGSQTPVGTNGAYTEALIAPGDSGGASFIDIGGEWFLVGVHQFTACYGANCSPDSSFGDFAGDTSVLGQQWLASYLVAAVPEPGTYGMLMAGLGLMGTVVRRRKRNA